jgi:hypothetical protein
MKVFRKSCEIAETGGVAMGADIESATFFGKKRCKCAAPKWRESFPDLPPGPGFGKLAKKEASFAGH